MEVAVTTSWAHPHTKFCTTGGHASGHWPESRNACLSVVLAAVQASMVAALSQPRFGDMVFLESSMAPQEAACSFPGIHPARSAPAIILSAVRRCPS